MQSPFPLAGLVCACAVVATAYALAFAALTGAYSTPRPAVKPACVGIDAATFRRMI